MWKKTPHRKSKNKDCLSEHQTLLYKVTFAVASYQPHSTRSNSKAKEHTDALHLLSLVWKHSPGAARGTSWRRLCQWARTPWPGGAGSAWWCSRWRWASGWGPAALPGAAGRAGSGAGRACRTQWRRARAPQRAARSDGHMRASSCQNTALRMHPEADSQLLHLPVSFPIWLDYLLSKWTELVAIYEAQDQNVSFLICLMIKPIF